MEKEGDQILLHSQDELYTGIKEEIEGDEIGFESTSSSGSTKKRRPTVGISSYGSTGTTPRSQTAVKPALQNKERLNQVDDAIARLFYEAGIPINVANSPYFQQVIDAIASIGLGYKAPTYHALRTNLLHKAKKDVELLIESFRSSWVEYGCTIMGDGWKDSRQRPLINFLVYCPKGISFIKSVDASDIVSDVKILCNLFSEVVEIVGPTNVVHFVIENAANYKEAGRLLREWYSNILWSPCAAHCLNLILKDISKMPHIQNLEKRASLISIFVHNHKWTLSWLRRRECWTKILRPVETRFATTFIALKSLYEHKCDLQALVTSREFNAWNGSKTSKGKEVANHILNNKFWNDCLVIVKIVTPLINLLRIVDSDEKPALGYVYEGMIRAINVIRETFKHKKSLYEPYTKIVEERWESQLRQDIHGLHIG